MLKIDGKEFQHNLLKTQKYCQVQLNNLAVADDIMGIASVFRSINPRIPLSKSFKFRKHTFEFEIEDGINTITLAHWATDPCKNPSLLAGCIVIS